MAEAKNSVQKEVLPNGLVIITEPMEHMHSVSVGIWLRAGSRREPAELNGISHFIEHMVFKGTARRTAEDIAREVDSVGGMLDAFTAKEMVCFNTRVLDEMRDAVERGRLAARTHAQPDAHRNGMHVLHRLSDHDKPVRKNFLLDLMIWVGHRYIHCGTVQRKMSYARSDYFQAHMHNAAVKG